MVKSGTTSKGRTKWRCKPCRITTTKTRPDITHTAEFTAFHHWITGKNSAHDIAHTLGVSRRTLTRRLNWCWHIQPPPPQDHGRIHDQLFIDATYLGTQCLLIAATDTTVISWHWCQSENTADYLTLLRAITPPAVVCCDGNGPALAAINEAWPEITVQRCLVHLQRRIRQLVSTRPRTDAGKTIRQLSLQLTSITTLQDAAEWTEKLNAAYTLFLPWLNHRTYRTNTPPDMLPSWLKPNQKWWYTHRNTRRAFRSLTTVAAQGQLFTYLDPPAVVIAPERLRPTTNTLEGGINAGIKRLVDHHRGVKDEHRRLVVEWWLLGRTEFPVDPVKIAAAQQFGARALHTAAVIAANELNRERVGTDDIGAPALFDRGIDTEYTHSLGVQKGWLGR